MKRILVISDSHGNNDDVRTAVNKATEKSPINAIVHLGDVGDFREVESIAGSVGALSYIVRGNTDYAPELKDCNIIDLGDHMIYATHGHREGVNFGIENLYYNALQNGCDFAFYGHTHVPFLDEGEDVTILNPGSISRPRQEGHVKTFAILEIDDNGDFEIFFDNID